MLSKLFRFFETRVDPFARVEGTPPANFWAFMWECLRPYKAWLPLIALASLLVAFIEVAIVGYSGRLIDLMRETGLDGFWQAHGLEVGLVAVCILCVRPVAIMFQHLLVGNLLASNMQDQVRWRGHTHLLKQSIGFFQGDFAGRLASRVVQQGPAAEDIAYIMFEAVWFAAVYPE